MKIKGLQKTTFIDYPGKIACTLFLFGCNFKCDFCHNPELVLENKNKDIPEEEILNFLEKRKEYLEGVCITGGEPLLSLKKDFVKKIKSLGYKIKLDTNGSFPEKLGEYVKENLVDFIAMDIKASKENYNNVVNAKVYLENIEKSIKVISSIPEYEFRTTILRDIHNEGEMIKIALWLNESIGEKPKKFCLQAFKNKGKILGKNLEKEKDVQEETLIKLKEIIQDKFEEIEIRA